MNRIETEAWLPSSRVPNASGPRVPDAGYDLLLVLFKWLPQMAVIVAVSLSCGLGYLIFVRGDLFQADAKLYVRVGVDQTPSPTLGSDRNVTFLAQTRGAVQSEMDLLRSGVLVSRLIDELGLAEPEKRPEPEGFYAYLKERAIESYRIAREVVDTALVAVGLKTPLSRQDAIRRDFAQSLILDNAVGSDVISVSLRWPDQARAVVILDRFLKIYEAFRSAVFQGEGETGFMTARRDAARTAVEAVEAEMAQFERTHDVRNAASRVPLLEGDLVEAQRAVDGTVLNLGLARRRLERLGHGFGPSDASDGEHAADRSEPAGLGTFAVNSPALATATSISALLGEREQLRVNSSAAAPEMKQIGAKISALTEVLRAQLEAEVQDLVRTEATARKRLAKVEASLREFQEAATAWKSLERGRDLAEARYRDAEKRLSEARDIHALRNARLPNVVVVQPAAAEGVPIGLRKLPMLGLIAACSAVLACGWALTREVFDGRLYRGDVAARELDLPLVGEVPEHRDVLRAWFRRGTMDGETDRTARLALDRIIVRLDERLKTEGKTVLAVVGGATGEGCSTIALMLALGIGRRRGRRVCLVCAASDPARAPRLQALGLESGSAAGDPPNESGLSVAAARPGPIEVGYLRIAGWTDLKTVADLLAPEARTISALAGDAALTVIDLPPQTLDPEAGLAAARADATLLVAAAGRHGARLHAAALDGLREQGADVIGLVLNRVRPYVPAWLERGR